MNMTMRYVLAGALMAASMPFAILAQEPGDPVELLSPRPVVPRADAPAENKAGSAAASQAVPVVQPLPGEQAEPPLPPLPWRLSDARALLRSIEGIVAEGLDPADYQPDKLRAAIAAGEGEALDRVAGESFTWLVEDLRDGRTPASARRQWFVEDPDARAMPTRVLMERALDTQDIAGVLQQLAPTHPDYARLREELAQTPASEKDRIAKLRANMDRWRWLERDLGKTYLVVNVPEFQLRFMVNGQIVRSYRTIVGKPGRTATPQLAEKVEGVVFNPTWTVPQSIVMGEGLGPRLLANPASARAKGYKVTRGADGYISVVQQPGPNNALGIVKLDMPNPHAIFLHDTPAKELFDTEMRAYSHGCIRVQDAPAMAMTLAIFGNMSSKEDIPAIRDEVVEILTSQEYTKYPLRNPIPVYITYFTVGSDVDGELATFDDLYERDEAVVVSLAEPRQPEIQRMEGGDAIVPIEAPGA